MIPTSLFDAQGSAINLVNSAYQQAITAPVSFTTAAGVAKTYQADPVSQANLQGALIGFTPTGSVPSGFYWRSLDNTNVPFTLGDLQGLAQVMLAQGWEAFQKRLTLLAEIAAATTVAQAEGVTW